MQKKRAIKQAKKAGRARGIALKNKALAKYQQSISGLKDLGKFAATELASIYDRMPDTPFKKALAKYINPVLRMFGLQSFTQLMVMQGTSEEGLPSSLGYGDEQYDELFDELDFDEPLLF